MATIGSARYLGLVLVVVMDASVIPAFSSMLLFTISALDDTVLLEELSKNDFEIDWLEVDVVELVVEVAE
ncbi:MAG TPA: hypothetical protein VJ044_20290, partial [Candidatus Hodarchaeales archaeon]|nr:hypothetical protein [Candidatus Hodarchaeales archaeon]